MHGHGVGWQREQTPCYPLRGHGPGAPPPRGIRREAPGLASAALRIDRSPRRWRRPG